MRFFSWLENIILILLLRFYLLKREKLFIITLLLLSFSTKAQILTDGGSAEIVGDIILNYKEKGVNRFKIIYKDKFGKKLSWKDVFYYSFENDSILHHNYRKYKASFLLNDDEFIYQDNEEDKKRNAEYLKTNYFKISKYRSERHFEK